MRTFFIYLHIVSATDLSETKKTVAEVLNQNRTFVLVMLGVPVFGMAIAFGIILWKQPDNMIKVLAVIFFVAVQYVLMMFFWSKRVALLAKKDAAKKLEAESMTDSDSEEDSEGGEVLKPEEERLFPSEKESDAPQ